MSEEIKPALSAEEWANPNDVLDGYVSIADGVIDVRLGGAYGTREMGRERLLLAGLLLEGQSFGFTREMLEALRKVFSEWKQEKLDAADAMDFTAFVGEELTTLQQVTRALAVIASLLPPEPTDA